MSFGSSARTDAKEMEVLSPILGPKLSSSWVIRTFSPIKPGSIRGSIFTLVSTAIGAGCLSLPSRMANSGIILSLGMLLVVAIVAYLSIVTIAKAAAHYNVYHFSELISCALGRRTGIVIDFIIIIYIYGTILGYQILVGTFVPSVLHSFGLHYDETLERDLSMVIMNIVVIIPLGMLRNLSSLRFASIVSVLALSYIAIVLVAELQFFHTDYDNLKYFDFDTNIFSTYAITLYAFVCHCNVPIVHNEMVNRSVKRMSKAGLRAIAIVLCGYIVVSLFGYLSVPVKPPMIITQRDTPPGIDNDWVMVVGRVMFSSTIIIAVPINTPPFRNSFTKFFFKKDKASTKLHVLMTLGLLLSTLAIAIFYPDLTFVFNFLGGFCSSTLVLLIPGILHYRLSNKSWTAPSNLFVLFASVFLTLAGFTAVVISTIDLV